MTILVTGGAGYIGSHTCIALLEEGYDIAVLDTFATSRPEVIRRIQRITGKKFPVFTADLLNLQEVKHVFENIFADAVIHFAGLKKVNESILNPLKYYQSNLISTINICTCMEMFDVTKLVFSSSATVYGPQGHMPVTENTPSLPMSPYGRTKVMNEEILNDIVVANPDWSIALLRYFNPIGAHPSGLIGEDPKGVPSNLLPYIAQVAVGRIPYLTVNGHDYSTPDGTCIRDFIHVMDLAEGHIKALEYLDAKNGLEVFNLGTGRGYSVLEVLNTFQYASGVNIPYRVGARRPGDVPVSYADVNKAQDMLGWRATRSLEDMCRDAWHWQSRNPDGYATMSMDNPETA